MLYQIYVNSVTQSCYMQYRSNNAKICTGYNCDGMDSGCQTVSIVTGDDGCATLWSYLADSVRQSYIYITLWHPCC